MSKESLLLLPGLMCDETVWIPLLEDLSKTHDCTVVDHGRADSLSVMAKNILRQAPNKFALAGHSMGGRIAIEVIRQAPERVSRVALMNTGYLPRPDSEVGAKEMQTRYELLKIAIDQGVEAMARTWVKGMVAPARLSDEPFIQRIIDNVAYRSHGWAVRELKSHFGGEEDLSKSDNKAVKRIIKEASRPHNSMPGMPQNQGMLWGPPQYTSPPMMGMNMPPQYFHPPQQMQGSAPPVCYRCNQPGHIARSCTSGMRNPNSFQGEGEEVVTDHLMGDLSRKERKVECV